MSLHMKNNTAQINITEVRLLYFNYSLCKQNTDNQIEYRFYSNKYFDGSDK